MALIVKCNFNAHITSFRSVQDLFCWNLNWLPWQFFWERKKHIFRYYYTHFVHNKKWTSREKLNQARFCVTYFKLSLNCIYLQENRYAWYFIFVSQLVSMQNCWNDNIYYFSMHTYFVFVLGISQEGILILVFNVVKTRLFIEEGSFSWYLHYHHDFAKPKYV